MLKLARHRVLGWMAAAMLLAGCQYDSIVNEFREESGHSDSLTISFGNGVIDNPIRTRSVNLLSQYTNTMGVWGWQTTLGNEVVCLFNNTDVTYSPGTQWTYSPARYWEKGSSYRFYAYAPHGSTVPQSTVSINEQTGRFTIQNVILNGCNTMSNAAKPSPSGTFINVDDVDWMIDREGKTVTEDKIYTLVTFNMQHLLAKFNVIVKTSGALSTPGKTVVIDSLSVGDFVSKGSFTQLLDHSPVAGVAADSVNEWTIDTASPRYTLQGTRGAVVNGSGCCVIESLLLPQDVTAQQQVSISYTIRTKGGHVEHFKHQFMLNDAFNDSFRCATNNTLTITIDPVVITFDSNSTQWKNEYDEAINVDEDSAQTD